MKMTDSELVAIIKAHRADSLGVDDGDLAQQRADAMDHYHGRPYGTEVVGRSQVVSRDLSETVDWIMPALMRVFVQSSRLGEFDPVGPKDVKLAQQESDYVNRIMMQKNPGFMILHDAIKDCLLLKNGYTKEFWEKYETVKVERYKDLSTEQLTMLMADLSAEDTEVEVLAAESEMTEFGEMFDVELRIKRECGKATWIAIPAEEVRVSKKCRGSLMDSPFVEHETKKTRSELVELGMPRSFVDSLPAYNDDATDGQKLARDSTTDESDVEHDVVDRSMELIDYCEAYIRVDYDGDGVAELRRVITCADRIPPGPEWNETTEVCAITGWVSKRVPHRHVGESLDDELADLQEIKTTLQRQMLDNAYFTNTTQVVVNQDVYLPDFLTNQPGGVKRTTSSQAVQGSVMQLQVPPIIPHLLPAIDYIDKVKETRSGVRPGSDLDPDVLQNVTKGAFMEHMNRASQKIEMIARMIAETGVKESFLKMHGLLIRHQNQREMVQLRGNWMPINPAEWRERNDLTIRIGLGTGNEDDKRQKITMLAQAQFQLLQAATSAPPMVYAKMYAMFEELCATMGMDMPEKFAIAPNGPEYQEMQRMLQQRQQQPNPDIIKIQQQGQLEQQRMAMQQQVDRNRQELEAQQQAAKIAAEERMAQFKAQLDSQLERQRMMIKAETDKVIATINAQAKLDAAQLTAQTTLTPEQEAASDGAVDA